jgi:hypothetical protein
MRTDIYYSRIATVMAGIITASLSVANVGAGTSTAEQLDGKARRLQAIIESKTLQTHGLIPMLVRAEDYQLPTAEDYQGAYKHRHLRDKTEAEIGIPPRHVWRAWEDASANTGFYLGAMAYQYRCTQDAQALAICRRTLLAIKYIHDLAANRGEAGFLCKPYGGTYSNQTSGDQLQCVVVGLAAYLPVAPPNDRAIIDKLMGSFADHQIATDYQPLHGYFAYPRGEWGWKHWDWGDGLIWSPLLYLAWNNTGDPKYLREIDRWYKHCGLEKRTPPPSGKTIGGSASYRMLYLPTLMMEFDPQHYELWRSFMVDSFQRGKTGVPPDGTTYPAWHYNPETRQATPLASRWAGGPTRTGRSSIFAKGCVQSQRWFPQEDMVGVARTIIEGLDEPTFRFVMPAQSGQELTPEWRVEGRLLDHDSLTAWLWAFWEGRWRGYW